jgi:trehalose synthase
VVHQVSTRGARVLRFDAVPFLGIEPDPGKALSKHYLHPLAVNGTNQLAFLTRKLGGWSFHELNVPLGDLKLFTRNGPDLSYDFFTRAQCVHALLTGDAGPLRLAFQLLKDADIQPLTLVHDLQNHDEITYQLVELDYRKDEEFTVNGRKVTGKALREEMLRAMRERAAGPAAPYNRLYRPEQDGVATTFAAFVAASLEIRDPYQATVDQVQQIRRGHQLLVLANAMQPGVLCLSSWDLVGALPVPEKAVAKWIGDGDYRWMNRGGVDLMGVNPRATTSAYGLPRAKNLYGPLPEQLKDPDSFASQVKRILAGRQRYRLAEAELVAVPEVKNASVALLVLRLPQSGGWAITALNFGRREVQETLDFTQLPGPAVDLRGGRVQDAVTDALEGKVPESGRLKIQLPALTGKTLVIGARSP